MSEPLQRTEPTPIDIKREARRLAQIRVLRQSPNADRRFETDERTPPKDAA